MPQRPFPVSPHYTAIAIAYRNKALIADEVLPRVRVSKEEFRWLKHKLEDGFSVPDTRVGRRGRPSEVSFSATEETARTEDYGLEDPVPQSDIDNASDGFDPLAHSTEMLASLIALDREKRTADLVFKSSNYAGNTRQVSDATEKFSHKDANPIATIGDALDIPVMRPNIMVIGQAAFTALSRNPIILKAVHGNSGDAGIARKEAIAELFGLEGLFVGQAFLNAAKKGQTRSLAQVWGKHVALIYRDQLASTERGTTFGYTGEFGSRVAGAFEDKNIGLRGGQRVRVGESVKEIICAPALGYLLTDVTV